MHILVLGASGKVGSKVICRLLDYGHKVRAFTYGAAPFAANENLEIIQGDVHNAADIKQALEQIDAVISCLGSWGTPNKDILGVAMSQVVPEMERRGIKRIVSLTGSGAAAPNERLRFVDKINRGLLLVGAEKILRDGEKHLQILAESTLDWTVIRSPIMANGSATTYSLSMTAPLPLATVPREAVVAALVDQLDRTTEVKKAPHIRRS